MSISLHVCIPVCVFAEMQREHQRREHRLQEAHCCALSTMEEARQHQIRVGFTHTNTHEACMHEGEHFYTCDLYLSYLLAS